MSTPIVTLTDRVQEIVDLREQAIKLLARSDMKVRQLVEEFRADPEAMKPIEGHFLEDLVHQARASMSVTAEAHQHSRAESIFPGVAATIKSHEDMQSLFPTFNWPPYK